MTQLQANQQAQAQQQVQTQQAAAPQAPVDPQPEPMEVQAQAAAPPRPTTKKDLAGTKGNSAITASSMQAIVAPPTPQQASGFRVRSLLELLETQNYGSEQQQPPSQPKEAQETEVLDSPPKPEFGELLTQIRHFLQIPEPS